MYYRPLTIKGATVMAAMDSGPMAFGARHRYHAVAKTQITEKEAKEIQQVLGFHPAGYGFDSFKTGRDGEMFTASWESSVRSD